MLDESGSSDQRPADKSGENETLAIMDRFRRFYEGKLREIESAGGGDCLQLKLKVQQKWIEDLTEQTEMMAKIVRELEVEASDRVQKLEEKLRHSSKTAYEVMKRYQTFESTQNLDDHFQKSFYLGNDVKNLVEFIRRIRDEGRWSIDGLQFYEIEYSDLFGRNNNCQMKTTEPKKGLEDLEQINSTEIQEKTNRLNDELHFANEKLKIKEEECETMRQSMYDMRGALTEEVAYKHDMILSLKKDLQQLEERCVQSDKQTAFKDDIIKELRKEIKQMKQQGTENKINALQRELGAANKKLWKLEQEKENSKADNNPTNPIPLQDLCQQNACMKDELTKRNQEICNMKCYCDELHKSLKESKGRADNLQKAVEQQKITIANLQEALVSVKSEFGRLNQQDQVIHQFLYDFLQANAMKCEIRTTKCKEEFRGLYEINFELELEHFNCLQDLAMMETQLFKYQSEFRQFEDTKNEVKKLKQQKKCYEHIVCCFKQEMTVMSEQLANLQEILNLSNKSCKEESCQLHCTVNDLQQLNERLKRELLETEEKVVVENHLNQIKDAQIGELQQIIGQKNVDLNMHDEAIHEMKKQVDHINLENHEFQATVVSLNSTIMQLQLELQNRELSKCKDRTKVKTCASALNVCQQSISNMKGDLVRKTKKLEKLESEYRAQKELLGTAKVEIESLRERSREKLAVYKIQMETLKENLNMLEAKNQELTRELYACKCNDKQVVLDCTREHELSQYKQIVLELRQTLIEINENLSEDVSFHNMPLEDDVYKENVCIKDDIYASCRCQINLYKKFVDNMKISLIKATQKVTELKEQNNRLKSQLHTTEANMAEIPMILNNKDEENRRLVEQLKMQDVKLTELHKILSKKEKETCEHVREMAEKLETTKMEEKCLKRYIDELHKQIERKEQEACCKSPNEQEAAQQEVESLKSEIQRLIQNQYSLNSENDKLLEQVTRLQGVITSIEETNKSLEMKLEQAKQEIKCLKENKKELTHQKEKLASDLQNLQTIYNKLEKTACKSVQSLEQELTESRTTRDDLCNESRHVVNNVKAWLDEQRKINEQVKKKAQCYCSAIEKLKKENEARFNPKLQMCPNMPPPQAPSRGGNTYRVASPERAWTLGSQGSGTPNCSPRDSPSSFLTCSVDEWYASNYRTETDETDNFDDGFLEKIEALTNRMRENNRKYTKKCNPECSKSNKDKSREK